MSDLRLLSVNINNNYQEPGDRLVLTAKWQNAGNVCREFNAQICVNVQFCGRHRLDSAENGFYSFKWSPFPSTDMWKSGEIWSTAGIWTLPKMWGGSYKISISLLSENGETVYFYGSDEKPTRSQYITEIDVGWGWGRNRLLEQRHPLEIEINKPLEQQNCVRPDAVCLGGFLLNSAYPAVCGFEGEEWYDFPPEVTVRCVASNELRVYRPNDGITYSALPVTDNRCEYKAEAEHCSFTLAFTERDGVLSVELANAFESLGYELIDIKIPSVAQCFDGDGGLVNFYGGGRTVPLKTAVPQSVCFPYDTCNAVGLYGEKGSFAVITDDPDVILCQSVVKRENEVPVGVIGAVISNRVAAGKDGLASVPVKASPVEVHFARGENRYLAAEILRSRLPKPTSRRYDNTLLYKINLDGTGQIDPNRPETYREITTLKEAKEFIMKIHRLSGGMKQVVYLVGWQRGGHDFEYPYPHKSGFNPRCGTVEEFNHLREELKAFNVELSFHDNFDDAYLSDAYEINKDILSTDEKGEPWRGWLWAGGMSYIISPSAYLQSEEIKERIAAVTDTYGIENTYHLDVLSSEVRRYSFNPLSPSAAADNINAKRAIIGLFNEKGIDVTSETLSFPFIGEIGYAQNTRCTFEPRLFEGETVVPLTTLAFHGVTPYKMSANGDKKALLRALAAGASCSLEAEKTALISRESEIKLLRSIYITDRPMSLLSYKKAISARVNGNKWTVEYEDNSAVEVDFENEAYSVTVCGKTVSKDFVTFMPTAAETYCYYSVNGGVNELVLPCDWNSVTVEDLSGDAVKTVKLNGGRLCCDFSADTPYLIKKSDLEGI